MRRLLVLFIAATLFSLNGCESAKSDVTTSPPSEAPAVTTVNTLCPISSKPVEADSVVEFEGQKVGLCCQKCCAKWEGMSTEEKTAALAKVKN